MRTAGLASQEAVTPLNLPTETEGVAVGGGWNCRGLIEREGIVGLEVQRTRLKGSRLRSTHPGLDLPDLSLVIDDSLDGCS